MSFILGLTGSIGMGKSTTAMMFAECGVPVWDADATVRTLYQKGGAAVELVATYYPFVVVNGVVSRPALRNLIADDPKILDHLQTLVHPLVAQDRAEFIAIQTAPIVLLDVPLLYETGVDAECDGVVVVSVPESVQKKRVMQRAEMSEADFEMILSRQMPDREKRDRARWVIETLKLDAARQSVTEIISEIEQELANA